MSIDNIDAVRIVAWRFTLRSYFGIEISAIQIGGGNAIAVVRQLLAERRARRLSARSLRGGELILGNVVISADLNVIDQRLRAFLDVKGDVDFGFVIGDLSVTLTSS